MNNKKNTAGFTLLEMIVVLGIIAILVGIVLLGIKGAQKSAEDVSARNALLQINVESELYRLSKKPYYPSGFLRNDECGGFMDSFVNDPNVEKLVLESLQFHKGWPFGLDAAFCGMTPDSWAIAVPLPSDPTKSLCTDDTGGVKLEQYDTFDAHVVNIDGFMRCR